MNLPSNDPVPDRSRRRTILKAALGTALTTAAGLGAASLWLQRAPGRAGLREFTAADIAFGTTVSLMVLHHDEATARNAMQAALAAVRNIDQLMSLYRADSEISRLNRDGQLDHPDAHLLTVLQHAQALSQQTRGAFDITVQPLWEAAASGRDTRAELGRIGWRHLQVHAQRVAFRAPGMAVTLNGVAQGYGVDVALAALKQHGIRDALLDTGEFASVGQRDDGKPWTLAVRDPRDEHAYARVLAADGRCLATSGDYETHFSEDFSRHHIVDPSTGLSPRELASVSVLAPTGMQADGLSTAMMVLGLQASLDLAARTPGVDIFCVGKDGARHATPGFPADLA